MACDGAGFPASEPVRSCGASIKGPPERRSLAPRGLFGRRKVACLASDAPCRTLLPVIEPQSKRAPEPLPPPPRQRLRLSRPEAPGRPASRYRRPPARTPRLREKPARTSVPLASPRLRSARRPRALRPEARNGACQHCNPLRSASTAWDRLSPGGRVIVGKGRNPHPTVPRGNPRGGEVALTRRRNPGGVASFEAIQQGFADQGPETSAFAEPGAVRRDFSRRSGTDPNPTSPLTPRVVCSWSFRLDRPDLPVTGSAESRLAGRSLPKQRLVRP